MNIAQLLTLYRARHTATCEMRCPEAWIGPAPCTCGLSNYLKDKHELTFKQATVEYRDVNTKITIGGCE